MKIFPKNPKEIQMNQNFQGEFLISIRLQIELKSLYGSPSLRNMKFANLTIIKSQNSQ